jgi:uncharacterized OB-fold protein
MDPVARPVPEPTEVSQPFWDATREHRLVVQRCDDCHRFVWYPRPFCPGCLGAALTWTDVDGTGTVYAVSAHHRTPIAELAGRTPVVVALVDLDAGVRMLTNLVGAEASGARVGDRVVVAWEPLDDGRCYPAFEPTAQRA